MPSPKLAVAIYRPGLGNIAHWALAVETTGVKESVVYEVIGSHHRLRRQKRVVDLGKSQGLRHLIFLDSIQAADVATVNAVAQCSPIDYDCVGWNGQDYVMEMIKTLERECVLDTDEPGFRRAKRELLHKFGPMY